MSAGKRIGLEHVQRLIERGRAKEGHLTEPQLTEFMRNPDGPRLPELCLEARRLPEELWPTPEAYPIRDIAVAPDGTPCIAAVVDGACRLVRMHGSFFMTVALTSPETGERSEYDAQILGFLSDAHRTAVVRTERRSDDGHDGVVSDRMHVWYVGEGRVQKRLPCGDVATLLSDGEVVSMYPEDDGKSFRITRGDHVFVRTRLRFQKFIELPNGQVAGVACSCAGSSKALYIVRETSLVPSSGWFPQQFVDADVFGEHLVLIDNDSRPVTCAFVGVGAMFENNLQLQWRAIGRHDYLVRYTRFANGRDAYIGRPVHREDRGACWVIDGEAQPVFEAMTALSQDHGGVWCYWAASGRYLYKMAVPPAA